MNFEILGWVAATTSGARAFPQLARLRTSSAGVSATSAAFTAVTAYGWVAWSAALSLWPVLTSSLLTALGFSLIWFRLKPRYPGPAAAASIAAWSLLLVLAAAYGVIFNQWGTLGWLGAVGSAVQFIPQAGRTLRSADLSGVSAGTYLLALANEVLWLAYAAYIWSVPLAAPYLLRIPVSTVILVQVTRDRRRCEAGRRASEWW